MGLGLHGASHDAEGAQQPVALVDFFVINDAKIPIFGAALGVCRVKIA
jgi:hypothetical protein